jgi:hypothetical protein
LNPLRGKELLGEGFTAGGSIKERLIGEEANGPIEERFLSAQADAFAQKRTRRKGVGLLRSE